jgi:hypothetical protein
MLIALVIAQQAQQMEQQHRVCGALEPLLIVSCHRATQAASRALLQPRVIQWQAMYATQWNQATQPHAGVMLQLSMMLALLMLSKPQHLTIRQCMFESVPGGRFGGRAAAVGHSSAAWAATGLSGPMSRLPVFTYAPLIPAERGSGLFMSCCREQKQNRVGKQHSESPMALARG